VPQPVIERAHVAEPGEAAGRIVACDECGYRRFYPRDGVEDLAIDDLLLEGAEEPFGHAVGFRLVWEGMAERDAPVGDLAGEVAGDVLRPIICPHRDTARGIGFDPAEASGDGLADRLERGQASLAPLLQAVGFDRDMARDGLD
jgi:hypothetical protein